MLLKVLPRVVLNVAYSVDAAYAENDPHRRIGFIAAFAMSNYSSTIGRIAKPFNPMLVRFSLLAPISMAY